MSIQIFNYGNYSSNNYGNCTAVKLGRLTIYFSYKTPVAYNYKGSLTVRQNDWDKVTGRHLNCIDGGNKKDRICGADFERELKILLSVLGL